MNYGMKFDLWLYDGKKSSSSYIESYHPIWVSVRVCVFVCVFAQTLV